MQSLKSQFLLDPKLIYLNHGSFGATPRPVFETYQAFQRELESQPVEFLGRRSASLMAESRQKLAEYLGVKQDDLVFFPNPTHAVNMVARNLLHRLSPGDEILATDHEYGALDRTWRFLCNRAGVHYINHPIPLPLLSPEETTEHFWKGVTDRTRAIFVSHITSPTAVIFPVKEICLRARQAGILTIIDGAHAVSQLNIDLEDLGVDIYTGACHKWLCAPKGSAFLHVRKEEQQWMDPLVVSWGYQSEMPGPSRFIDYLEWQGTRDISAFLSVPAAIEFQTLHHWNQVRLDCHAMALHLRSRLVDLIGTEVLCVEDQFSQMFSVFLPSRCSPEQVKQQLLDSYSIEIPVYKWSQRNILRVSFQAYNEEADGNSLIEALASILA